MNSIPFSPDWNLPAPPSPPNEAPRIPEPTFRSTAERSAPSSVIVAEDDPVSREVVSTLLRKWGYEPFVTRDGREAMEALRAQTKPVLAMLDWMMPNMDGIEVCRRVREIKKLAYILLLTARGGKEGRGRSRSRRGRLSREAVS